MRTVVDRGDEEGGRGGGGGLSLEETLRALFSRALLEPSWGSSSAFLGLFINPFGGRFWRSPVERGALRTTITAEDGHDSQRVNRVIHWWLVTIFSQLAASLDRKLRCPYHHILTQKILKKNLLA